MGTRGEFGCALPKQSGEDRNRGLTLGCGAADGAGRVRTCDGTLESVELEEMIGCAAPDGKGTLHCATPERSGEGQNLRGMLGCAAPERSLTLFG